MCAPLLVLSIAVSAACDATAPRALPKPAEAATRTLYAVLRVVDADTEAPVVGATVWSSVEHGRTIHERVDVEPLPDTVTDEHGDARIDVSRLAGLGPIELACLDVHVYVRHRDYVTEWTLVDLSNCSTFDDEQSTLVRLERGHSLVGRIVDVDGAPVFGAYVRAGVWNAVEPRFEVELESGCYLQESERSGRVSFDLDGAFAEGDEPDAIDVFAWHPRYGIGSLRVPRDGAAPFTLRLEPSDLRVRGRVSRADGAPAGPERVELDCDENAGTPYASTFAPLHLDPDGRFEFHLPRSGEWTLEFPLGFHSELPLKVAPANSNEVSSCVLPGTWARVRVVDEWGMPLRCGSPMLAPVELCDAGPRPRWPERLPGLGEFCGRATDRMLGTPLGGGVIAFALREPGAYGVRACEGDVDGAWCGECVLHLEEGAIHVDATLTLRWRRRAESMRIDVRGHDGALLEAYRGVVVCAVSGVEVTGFNQHGVPSFACLGPGYFELALHEGRYRVRIEVDGLAPIDGEFEIVAGRDNVVVLCAQH